MDSLISVIPKNYRAIALAAVEVASDPIVLLNKKKITNFTDSGQLTQRGISNARDFEVRDGKNSILGFHDHPREMWIDKKYLAFATQLELAGQLRIETKNT